jgi:myo-inositol-1(or 4)-monophosphatase
LAGEDWALRQGQRGVPTPGELVDLAGAVALEAADLVRRGRRAGVEVSETKTSPIDIVTEVDKAAEALIYERLMAARPDDGFLGEEGNSADSVSGVSWIVDPIDGTVNFLYGLPPYSVSVAAAVGSEVVAGVVVDVTSGECFSATRGGGATCDGRSLRVRAVAPLSERLVLTGFSYLEAVRARQADAVALLLREVRDIRRLGSAALDLCAVGAGRADGYVEEGLNQWDMAAGSLVATEAGARVDLLPGAGGTTCVVCAPNGGFGEFLDLVDRCGFLRQDA